MAKALVEHELIAHLERPAVALAEGIALAVIEREDHALATAAEDALKVGELAQLAAVREARIKDEDVALPRVERLRGHFPELALVDRPRLIGMRAWSHS